jgi:UDP-N-acetylglucosamine--N-acetylmuramyl-(pentapeptide) pyrophosphoryl-undecaprenol N-acetylglucosamine transferase
MGHLVVMAAGTGGHIMPGLAVAREMQRRGWTVSWLGTSHGMENRLVPPSGIALDTVAFSGLRGKGLLHAATGGLRLLKAMWDCRAILKRRAADAVLLMSNKALLPLADRVAFGFDGAAARGTRNGVVTGNPVRAEIEAIAEPATRLAGRSGPLKLLVVGGSLGAQVLNRTVPDAIAKLPADARPQVLHQTGPADEAAVRAAYAGHGIAAEVRAFVDDMPAQLAACDLMVCRAGAITVSELCAAGVPAILVPLVVSTTAHQRDNAQWLAAQGGAVHLPQTELTPERLGTELGRLDRATLLTMATKARAQARPQAAARVADEIEALMKGRRT